MANGQDPRRPGDPPSRMGQEQRDRPEPSQTDDRQERPSWKPKGTERI